MTQRIFNTDNEKDMTDLWDILPDDIIKLTPSKALNCIYGWYNNCGNVAIYMLKINWHDKTEITRPIPEATIADIGKLCRFSLSEKARCSISLIEEQDMFGILTEINNNGADTLYLKDRDIWFNHCRRLTKQEIEELC